MKFSPPIVLGTALGCSVLLSPSAHAQTTPITELAAMQVELGEQGWGKPGRNLAIAGSPLSIAGKRFEKGLGSHAPAEMWIQTNGAKRFIAQVGLDDAANESGSIEFSVDGDGKNLWTSGVMKRGMTAQPVDVELTGIQTVVLRVGEASDGNSNDHAVWGEARFEGGAPKVMPHPVGQWLDTLGQPIQAHGGGILKRGSTYYWYGENKSQGANNKVGISGYESQDLLNWKPLGIVMPASGFPEKFRDAGVCERPKVIYNARTGKYVLWAHLDADNYKVAEAGVCVADKPEGPFQFVRAFRPVVASTFRDMNLFVDDDGAGYVFFAGDGNASMYIMRLSDDYLNVAAPLEAGKNWTRILERNWREAPAPFKFGKKYYLLTSGCSGWSPNPAAYATADSILGPWTSHPNPFKGADEKTSFRSQPTYVIPNPNGKNGEFIYLGDRWNPGDLGNSRYVWLPFSIDADGTFEISRKDGWRPR